MIQASVLKLARRDLLSLTPLLTHARIFFSSSAATMVYFGDLYHLMGGAGEGFKSQAPCVVDFLNRVS